MKENVTMVLAKFISKIQYEDLPKDTVQKAKEVTLDYLGALLAGYNYSSLLSKKITDLMINNGGKEEATIIGPSIKVPVINAALVNGVTSHVVELDDGHRIARGHPGVVVLSSALSTAEYLGSSGKDLITAITVGYDIFIRIASAVNPSHLKRGFHTTGTCGVFASAAAASKLFGLNTEETANALSLAGTQAAGLLEVTIDGQMAKALHSGKSAYAGVLAALLAKEGVRGPKTLIEGVKGFSKAMSDECDYDIMLKDLGKAFYINECYIKLYPTCRHTHSPIDAVLELISENDFSTNEIKKILIKTYPTAVSFAGELFKPETIEAAKFSIPYCICAALIYKKFGLNELKLESINNPTVQTLIDKVKIEVDSSLENSLSKTKGAEVYISLNDGRILYKKINLPKGEKENPISYDELIKKFTYCTDYYFDENRRSKIIDKILSIDQTYNVNDLFALLI